MKLTRTFRWSGTLLLLGIALVSLQSVPGFPGPVVAIGVLLLVGAVPVFAISATRHLLRGLLWRVGSRLLVSYLLIGILPVGLFLGLAFVAAGVLAGQLAGRRADQALTRRLDRLPAAAEKALRIASRAPTPEARRKALAPVLAPLGPGAGHVYVPAGGAPEGDGPFGTSVLPRTPPPAAPSFVARAEAGSFLGAQRADEAGSLLVYLPLSERLEGELEEETGIVVQLTAGHVSRKEAGQADAGKGKGRGGVTIETQTGSVKLDPVAPRGKEEPAGRPGPPKTPPAGPSSFLEKRFLVWIVPGSEPYLDWETGAPRQDLTLAVAVRTSLALEARRLFGDASFTAPGGEGPASIAVTILKVLGAVTGSLYLLAALLAGVLVYRIARAARRLSTGFSEIDRGNFAYRTTLKGHDQLAGMVNGFNEMAAHLESSVAARAEKETLERELRVARDLQRRLLPEPGFEFAGLSIAVDFRPAAAIGGDFYHFVAEGTERLSVVIADVSGHGLPTGLVMASAIASLSVLARSGADTATLLALLDAEIRRATDRRTFVTLGHARFDLVRRTVEVTNAGHLYPYRVDAGGTVTAVENPSRPLGLGLPPSFRTVSVPIAKGDLWVFLSDGVIEATPPGSDDQLGFERLEALLATCAGKGAAGTRDAVLAAWHAHTGVEEPEDDRTLLVLEVL